MANATTTTAPFDILSAAIEQYKPGGVQETNAINELNRSKAGTLAGVNQNLVSSGLANTTIGASAPLKWEEQVGNPGRLAINQSNSDNYMKALMAKLGYLTDWQKYNLGQQSIQQAQSWATNPNNPSNPNSDANRIAAGHADFDTFMAGLGGNWGGGASAPAATTHLENYTPYNYGGSSNSYSEPNNYGNTSNNSYSEPIVMGQGYGPAFDEPNAGYSSNPYDAYMPAAIQKYNPINWDDESNW